MGSNKRKRLKGWRKNEPQEEEGEEQDVARQRQTFALFPSPKRVPKDRQERQQENVTLSDLIDRQGDTGQPDETVGDHSNLVDSGPTLPCSGRTGEAKGFNGKGKGSKATSGAPIAAKYAGLPIKRMQVAVYTIAGGMAGLAGVIHCAQNRQGNPNDGMAYELDAIAAVVIGGTSLQGGRGTIFGTVVGTLTLGVITNILGLKGVDENVKWMAKAIIIVLAVLLQQPETFQKLIDGLRRLRGVNA